MMPNAALDRKDFLEKEVTTGKLVELSRRFSNNRPFCPGIAILEQPRSQTGDRSERSFAVDYETHTNHDCGCG